jgi:hypothetical protein
MPLMSSDLGAFSAVGPRLRMIQGGMRRLAAAQKRRYRSFPISAVGLSADVPGSVVQRLIRTTECPGIGPRR